MKKYEFFLKIAILFFCFMVIPTSIKAVGPGEINLVSISDQNVIHYLSIGTWNYNSCSQDNAWFDYGWSLTLSQDTNITIIAQPISGDLTSANVGDYIEVYIDGVVRRMNVIDDAGNVSDSITGLMPAGTHTIKVDGKGLESLSCFAYMGIEIILEEAPTSSPQPLYCGGLEYNPGYQGCCGDVIYLLSTQACCGEPTSDDAKVYTKATEACCGPAEDGSFVFTKGGDESCCTVNGGFDVTDAGANPKIYYKKKGEKCCRVDDNTAPNVCNGCQKCVKADKSYVSVFDPDSRGWTQYLCRNGRINTSKGQCIDNCQLCTRCSDASKTTDGTNGTIDRRPSLPPDLGGGKQTEGFFCQKLDEILTDDYYTNHKQPTDLPQPGKAPTYSCNCDGYERPSGFVAEKPPQSCFEYNDVGGGFPPQPQYGQDNNCPITNNQPSKFTGFCWCANHLHCGIGKQNAQGYDTYVCADPGKSCAETTKMVGNVTVHYRASFAGMKWTYDCGNQTCCVLDSATANYCAGPWNMFCIHGKTPQQGKWCARTEDCRPIPDPDGGGGGGPVPGTSCDNTGKCRVDGGGKKCDIANGDADCEDQTYCDETMHCTQSGTHGVCDEDADCILSDSIACTEDKKCETNGTGDPCDLANGDADCDDQPTCTERETCEIDADDGGHGTCPSVDSVGDDRCKKDTKCEGQKCTTNGTGDPCDLKNGDADCADQLGCDDAKKCVAGGARGWCPSADSVGDAWCEEPITSTFCNASNQCVEDGTGNFCETDADCQPLACNRIRQCVPFGGGTGCTTYTLSASSECQGPLQCNNTIKKCVPDGGGIACTSDAQCGGNEPPMAYNLRVEHYYCDASAIFKWDYYDAENEPQVQYQLQMSTTNDDPTTQEDEFEDGLVYNTGFAAGSTNSIIVPVYLASVRAPGPCNLFQSCNGFINYGVSYYWRVKVWDSPDGFLVGSDWAYYQDTHTLVPHKHGSTTINVDDYDPDGFIDNLATTRADDKDGDEYTYQYPYEHPNPRILYEPQAIIVPSQPATFTDNSVCYYYDSDDESTTAYPCKNLIPPDSPQSDCVVPGGVCHECIAATDGRCYSWWFDDHFTNPADNYVIGNTSNTYSLPRPKENPYLTKLKICDDIGCCSAFKPVVVQPSSGGVIPQWWEITPYNR